MDTDDKKPSLEERIKKEIINLLESLKDYKRLNEFDKELRRHREDVVFSSLGLDAPTIIEWRIMGGLVQSTTRKLGDLFEKKITKEIIREKLGIDEKILTGFGYKKPEEGKTGNRKGDQKAKEHTRTLDILIPLDSIKDPLKQEAVRRELERLIAKRHRDINSLREKQSTGRKKKTNADKYIDYYNEKFDGIGIEVRYAYNIGDSKRKQADLDMAGVLTDPHHPRRLNPKDENRYLPVMLVYSTVNLSNHLSSLEQRWVVLQGKEAFEFLKNITGFDLEGFLRNNREEFKEITEKSLRDIKRKFSSDQETLDGQADGAGAGI
ncbi:hypothetical protein [Thermococcus sp.]|uniref:hypothetical protein n=1 Tax=Thermococcus sp. TaxID=35749 RepID=UPI0026024CBF|nr:hypothetical protein [Thermococcus sp.]